MQLYFLEILGNLRCDALRHFRVANTNRVVQQGEMRVPKLERRWVKMLSKAEKTVIAAACERFIAETLKPRFLPEIRPTAFNYPIDIFGKWRGSKYSFITRYRSGFPDNAGEEFDSAFTRLDHVEEYLAETRFDVMWHRHTGRWWRLHASVTLDEAFRLIEAQELLQPPI